MSAAPDREYIQGVAEQVLDDGYPFPTLHRWWRDKARELAQFILREAENGAK